MLSRLRMARCHKPGRPRNADAEWRSDRGSLTLEAAIGLALIGVCAYLLAELILWERSSDVRWQASQIAVQVAAAAGAEAERQDCAHALTRSDSLAPAAGFESAPPGAAPPAWQDAPSGPETCASAPIGGFSIGASGSGGASRLAAAVRPEFTSQTGLALTAGFSAEAGGRGWDYRLDTYDRWQPSSDCATFADPPVPSRDVRMSWFVAGDARSGTPEGAARGWYYGPPVAVSLGWLQQPLDLSVFDPDRDGGRRPWLWAAPGASRSSELVWSAVARAGADRLGAWCEILVVEPGCVQRVPQSELATPRLQVPLSGDSVYADNRWRVVGAGGNSIDAARVAGGGECA